MTENTDYIIKNGRVPMREGESKGNLNEAPRSPRPSNPPPSQTRQPPQNDRTTNSTNGTSENSSDIKT